MNFKWWIRMYFFIGMYILRWYIWFSGPQGDPQNSPRIQMYVFPCMCPRMDNRSHKNLCVLEWESHATALPFRSYQRDLLQPQLNPRQKQIAQVSSMQIEEIKCRFDQDPIKILVAFMEVDYLDYFGCDKYWNLITSLLNCLLLDTRALFKFQVKIVINLQHTIWNLSSYVEV